MTGPKSSYVYLHNDVTAKNLDFYYSKLLDKIKGASCVALDFEFTGLSKAKTTDMNHRYVALKETIETHSIVSMGICIIRRNAIESDLVRSAGTDCQDPPQPPPASNSSNREKEDSSCHLNFECDNFEFLACTDTNFLINEDTGRFLTEHNFSFDRLFQQGIRFTTPLEQLKRTSRDYHSPLSETEQKERLKLSNLWQTIISILECNTIPLIVHNGLYDIMYLYHSFIGILPNTLREFETAVSSRFTSGIYDTKHLVNVYGSEFNANFLPYLFHKCDRLRQNSFGQDQPSLPYFEVTVNQPILPPTATKTADLPVTPKGVKRKSLHSEPSPKRKLIVCKAYAERGYCPKEKQGDPLHQSKSQMHDVQVVLDLEMGVSPYEQVYTSDPNFDENSAHNACFDAYMTAFVFCYLRLKVPSTQLQDNINKINIDSSMHPLRLPIANKK
ncbi:ribonuclease H-like domain-containing protein [Blakeslea trispora]|nr:ribonuclease H-like domain-containing protein [Blakeslea trispora]